MNAEEKAHKLAAWQAQADAWSKRLIDSYYSMRPGKRNEVFDRCRGRLGDLKLKIMQLKGHVVENKEA